MLAVVFSPDGHRLASAGDDQMVQVWDGYTGQPLGAFPTGHKRFVSGLAFSADGRRLATASADGTVRLWNADTGESLGAPLTGHSGPVWSVAFSPDGQLISAGLDKAVRTWPVVVTPEMLCDKLTANMSRKQWHEWISDDPDIEYQQQLCKELPPGE